MSVCSNMHSLSHVHSPQVTPPWVHPYRDAAKGCMHWHHTRWGYSLGAVTDTHTIVSQFDAVCIYCMLMYIVSVMSFPPVSDMPHCPSTRPRSSTEVAREQNMALLEEQMHIRSHSAHVMRQRQSFLSISRDSGAVASAKGVYMSTLWLYHATSTCPLSHPVSRQEEAGSSPESPLTETEEPSTARHMRLEPGTIPRKISTPIPHNRHEVVEAGSSLSVRGYSSPPSDAPPPAPTAHLPLVVPGPMYTPQLVAGIEADQKPGRVAMVVSARSPGTFTTLRGNSSFRHRHWSTGDSSASPSRKLHPLRGCVSPQPLTAVKGLRLQTSPSSEPCSSKGPNPLHDTTLATET